MAIKDLVFGLIRSMNGSERLYFRRNYTRRPLPLYVQLYDSVVLAIGQNRLDEAKLKQKFSNYNFVKHTLQRELEKALCAYHVKQDESMELLHQMLLVKALKNKNQGDYAKKIMQRTLGKTLSDNALKHFIVDEYINLALFNSSGFSYKEVVEVIQTAKPDLEAQADLVKAKSIYISLLVLRSNSNLILDAHTLQAINEYEQKLKELKGKTASNLVQHFYLMAMATVLYMKGRYKKAFQIIEQNMKLWQNEKISIELYPEYYIDNFVLFADIAVLNVHFDLVLQAIQHKCNQHLKDPSSILAYEIYSFRNRLRILHKKADYENVKKLFNAHEKKFEHWVEHANFETRVVLATSIAISYFVLEQYNESLYFINKTLSGFQQSSRKELQSFAYLFMVLIAFKINNLHTFENFYKLAYNKFYTYKTQQHFEKEILSTLHFVFKSKTAKNSIRRIEELLQKLEANKNDPSQIFVFNMFNFPLWFKSLLEKKNYKQVVKEHVAAQNLAAQF